MYKSITAEEARNISEIKIEITTTFVRAFLFDNKMCHFRESWYFFLLSR